MMKVAFPLLAASLVAAEDYSDTVTTTDLWKFCAGQSGSAEDEAKEKLETLLFQNPGLASSRSADHRGGAWWAWEFENAHALASLMAYGDDVLKSDEDQEGQTPKSMCLNKPDQDAGDCDALYENAKELVKELEGRKELKAEAEKQRKELELKGVDDVDMDDDDDDMDDDEIIATKATPPKAKKKEGDLNIAADADDDAEDDEL